MSRRPIFDVAGAIRFEEGQRRAYEAQRAAAERFADPVHSMPRRLVEPVEIGTTPEILAAEIEAAKIGSHAADGSPIAPKPAIALLIGRRQWRKLRAMPEAREHLECWPGGEETFAKVAIIVRRGAGPPRLFFDMDELDSAARELPQPLAPPGSRRRG